MAMSRTAMRLLAVSVLAFSVWTAGTALAFGWPAQFGGPGDPDDVAGELVIRGTVASPSLFLMLVLAVFAVLVRRLVGDARRGSDLPSGGAHLRRVPGSGVGVAHPRRPRGGARRLRRGGRPPVPGAATLRRCGTGHQGEKPPPRTGHGLFAAPLPVRRHRRSE